MQEPAEPEIIDGGMATSGLVAQTMISRFEDHRAKQGITAAFHVPLPFPSSKKGNSGILACKHFRIT